MKRMNKWLAGLLALIMVIGVLPVNVFAADETAGGSEPVVVIACSDFQDPSDQSNAAAPTGSKRVKTILEQIKADHSTATGFLFCGDLDKEYSSSKPYAIKDRVDNLKSVVTGVFSSMSDFVFVQGNHDQQGQGSVYGLAGTGAHDTEDYGVYVLDEDDYEWMKGTESKVIDLAEDLAAYFDAKDPAVDTEPIFVVSHVPLHYSARTYTNGDGRYAKYIFDVLQNAGEEGFTVIFLHGHDHSQGYDNYLGGAVDYLPVGHDFYVADPTDTARKTFTTETLNFTYMNAGYIGYYADYEPDQKNTSGVDDTLTMSVFTITDGKVTVERYSKDGRYKNLKSAGVGSLKHAANETTIGLTKNRYFTDVITCPQTITLKTPAPVQPDVETVEYTDTASGVKITYTQSNDDAAAAPVITVDTRNQPTNDAIERFINYDIRIGGFVNSTDTATLLIPMPAGWVEARTKVYYNNMGVLEPLTTTFKTVDGVRYAEFTTNHFSTYTLAEGKEVTIDDDEWKEFQVGGETTYTYTLDTDGVDSGEKYIIVGGGSNNYVMTATGSTGSGNGTSVSISNNKIVLDTNAYEWEVTKVDSSGYAKTEITASGFGSGNNTYTLSNPGNYYYLNNNGNYRQVTSAVCTRGGYGGNRTYSWEITYKTNSGTNTATVSGQTITLYQPNTTSGYTFRQNGKYAYFDGNTSNPAAVKVRDDSYLWSVTRDGSSYRIGEPGTNRTIRYNSGFGIGNNDGNRVRLFKLTDTKTVNAETYYLGMEYAGNTEFSTAVYADEAALLAYVKSVLTVLKADENKENPEEYTGYTLSGPADPTTAGSYTYTVTAEGKELGSFTLTFADKTVASISLVDSEGVVIRAPKNAAEKDTGAKLLVTYDDGSTAAVNITTDMLSGDALDLETVGYYENLTVSYNGQTASEPFALRVVPRPEENDYPEYPHGGSVQVTKTGEGVDFQNTGVAKIELTASGVPITKGIDVIVMVDTSSSMNYGAKNGTSTASSGSQRIDFLRNSLTAMLEKFSAKHEDGTDPDVRLALADFNGYTKISGKDKINFEQTRENQALIFTSETGSADASAFIQVGSYTEKQIDTLVNKVATKSGTNFDYAFDTIYRLGHAIQEKNEEDNVKRDLFVIFMSDGCPFQYNYFTSQSDIKDWNSWLTGKKLTVSGSQNNVVISNITNADDLIDPTTLTNYNSGSSHSYFYNAATNNTHRMADAVKGAKDDSFTVISPTDDLPGAKPAGQDYMYTVNGLGATVYSIAFCLYDDHWISASSMETAISRTATDPDHFFDVKGTDAGAASDAEVQKALDKAFTQIATEISEAATGAYFVDEMGEEYDLMMRQIRDSNDKLIDKPDPVITASVRDVYNRSDIDETIDGHLVTEDDVGKPRGTDTVLETVTFNADGTEAYSDQSEDPDTNILGSDGVIRAKTFYYNTTDTEVTLEDGFVLSPETFRWSIGTIRNKEFVLTYYVYLTGTMEGEREPGSYPTNGDATLYYTNWLEHDAHLDAPSPVLPWKEALVSYAFYLVDENGKPIINRATGETGTFVHKIGVTEPVPQTILLNSSTTDNAKTLFANELLPEGYELFDEAAEYQISIKSGDGNSSWTITTGENLPKTTYVTDYGSAHDFTTEDYEHDKDGQRDISHTTVWFAVKFNIGCVPDVVVIDYGIPVDIDVTANDIFDTSYATIVSLKKLGENETLPKHGDSIAVGFDKTVAGAYGTASVRNGAVHYELGSMTMDQAETFIYAMLYMNPDDSLKVYNGYYYSTVTVVPATTIYYEDSFVTFSDEWEDAGTTDDKTQGQDRPGFYSFSSVDADNIYGYDPANGECITYSLGSAKKVTVSKGMSPWPTATFTFTGSGFDLVSVTSQATGTIAVDVYQGDTASGTPVQKWIVDTYYGFDKPEDQGNFVKCTWTYEDGMWTLVTSGITDTDDALKEGQIKVDKLPADPIEGTQYVIFYTNYSWEASDSADALYQIPVIKSYENLSYGTYTVVVTPKYSSAFDHVKDDTSYDFYLDSIRVYNPADYGENANVSSTSKIVDVYKQDNEAYPQYIEIRENLISSDAFSSDEATSGAVFIDAFGLNGSISEYTSFGPNNEVYLSRGQSIAFNLTAKDGSRIAAVHIGAKCVNAATSFTVNGKSIALKTATDMYYDITGQVKWNDDNTSNTIIITNKGDKIVSLTTIKLTYSEKPAEAAMLTSSRRTAFSAVKTVYANYLNSIVTPAPVVTESVETEPVVTEPVVFEPETFVLNTPNGTQKVGKAITVEVTTSSEAAGVTVNGVNAKAGKAKKGVVTWTASVYAEEAGSFTITAVCVNADGTESDPESVVITVKGDSKDNSSKDKKNKK